MSNSIAAGFLSRLIAIETERRQSAGDRKDLSAEMKSAKLTKEEVAGIKLAAKRHFEEADKRVFREAVENFAESLGHLADTPLGRAAAVRADLHA